MLDDLLEANKAYAAQFSLAGIASRASKGVGLLTCMDTRIEPLAMLGLRPGDAKILRNAGARVTPDVIRSFALASHFLGVEEIVVVQHTDCALARRSDDEIGRDLKALEVVDQPETGWMAMPDPDESLRADVRLLSESPLLAKGVRVEGWRYDVATGSIERLVAADQ